MASSPSCPYYQWLEPPPHAPDDTEPHEEEKEKIHNKDEAKPQQQQRNLCDFCSESRALLYCRADNAKLCFACDRHVHAANPLFSKHLRSYLCDTCASNPASIRCFSHDLFLCHNCDWDAHDGSAAHHDRRPLDGFSGSPSAFEFLSVLGFEDKALLESDEGSGDWAAAAADGFLDACWVWETPPVVSLDDLIVPTTDESCRNFQALGFPPPPKLRTMNCGKHREEIIRQLRDLVKSESGLDNSHRELKSLDGFQCVVPDHNLRLQHMVTDAEHDSVPIAVPGSEDSGLQRQDDCCEETARVPSFYQGFLESSTQDTKLVPEGPSDVQENGSQANKDKIEQHHPVITGTAILPPKSSYHGLAGQHRDSAISRYKEKKKARRYEKLIRYESRKARADSRIRIKGRFAKVNQDQNMQAHDVGGKEQRSSNSSSLNPL